MALVDKTSDARPRLRRAPRGGERAADVQPARVDPAGINVRRAGGRMKDHEYMVQRVGAAIVLNDWSEASKVAPALSRYLPPLAASRCSA